VFWRGTVQFVEPAYTPTQGQYLAFIYYYTKLNGVPPAIFQSVAAFGSPDDPDPGEARLHRAQAPHGRSIGLRLSREQPPDQKAN
jgi:hypothetical protein